ncbi:MAG: 2-amino-4-hydroxy-6-hydroxymethyldihydropteridine diphosphokinase [Planctomycetota bacterium]|nr:MAG: 2-amino-4-hydroxy-6-hydroxymethyldihydropteridine diphosphokinase [Planctomycetota bacterium]
MEYVIAVGSNRGDRAAMIATAAAMLPPQIRRVRSAPLVETEAVGGPSHSGPFLNGAWVVETRFGPHHLLWHLLALEQRLGRSRGEPDAPRGIDLDLICAKSFWQVESPFLTLPHPRCHLRPFVLQPIACIAGDWQHPILGVSFAALWHQIQEP